MLVERKERRVGLFQAGADDDMNSVIVLILAEDRDEKIFQVEVVSSNHPAFERGMFIYVNMDDVFDVV